MTAGVAMIQDRLRTLALALALGGLALCLAPAGCDSDGGGATDGNRFASFTPPAGKSAIGGRILDPSGAPVAEFRVAACSQQDCPITTTGADGLFLHEALEPDRPRAIYAHGTHNFRMVTPRFANIVVRTHPLADEVVDVGDLVLPELEGEPVPANPATGGTFTLAGGALTVTIPADALSYAIGTVEENQRLQAGRLHASLLPTFPTNPWRGKEDRSLVFSVAPWELRSHAPIGIAVTGSGEPSGTVFDVHEIEPFSIMVEVIAEPRKVGTATLGADGVIRSDPGSNLRSLILFVLVPQT